MKHVPAKCQFCQKPLFLKIADDYQSDYLKLVPLAACNSCADLRVKFNREEDVISKACYRLIQLRHKKDTGLVQQQIMELLSRATRKYADSVAMINGVQTAIWDMEFPNLLFERPERFGKILSKYRLDCRSNPPS